MVNLKGIGGTNIEKKIKSKIRKMTHPHIPLGKKIRIEKRPRLNLGIKI